MSQSCFSLGFLSQNSLWKLSTFRGEYEISPFLTASQAPNDFLTDVGMVRKGFGNKSLKDVTMERMRIEEFEESLCEDCGWVNLVFL